MILYKTSDLSYEIDSRTIFSNLDFEISSNAIYEIRGDNGSGKSSLLKILSGLNKMDNVYYDETHGPLFSDILNYIPIYNYEKININVEADAINKPLAAEANVIANTTSDDDKGLCTTSVIVPIIFPIIKDELE